MNTTPINNFITIKKEMLETLLSLQMASMVANPFHQSNSGIDNNSIKKIALKLIEDEL